MTMRKLIRSSLFGALLLLPLTAVQADRPSLASLQIQINQLQAQVNALQAQLANVTAINPYVSLQIVNGQPTVRFSDANVQIVNGTGNTDSVNGRGNLLIGYDKVRDDDTFFCSNGQHTEENTCTGGGGTWAVSHKTGSHYLVIGDENNYSQTGGQVVGFRNTCNGHHCNVNGGLYNTASGVNSSVSGGLQNIASGPYSSVTGGEENEASGNSSNVSGGNNNTASGWYGSVSGGYGNAASGYLSSVSGGVGNTASGEEGSSVSGGHRNTASGAESSVSGGEGNTASGWFSSVLGGNSQNATVQHQTIPALP